MRKLLMAALLVPLVSFAWTLEDLNDSINQTNFIVDDKCSGTLVSLEHKLVLTNHHCITAKVKEYTVEEVVDGELKELRKERLLDVPITQRSYQGYRRVGSTEYQTVIVAKEKGRDLALLQIRAETIPYTVASKLLPNGESVLRGETAYAVGNPQMLDASVTKGVISSTTRMLRPYWANNEEMAFMQYDGGIVGGNSGGALYNDNGYLIGVPAAVGRDSTVGLAIPHTVVREFMDENCYPVYMGGVLKEKGDEGEWYCKGWGEREIARKKSDSPL